MPLELLRMGSNPQITDISALKGMPIKNLQIPDTRVRDISPLKGMPLTDLICYKTLIKDLTPLKGMPLVFLDISSTPVNDISALANLPLKRLNLNSCKNLHNLTALKNCKSLEHLQLPPEPGDISFLKQLPNLRNILKTGQPYNLKQTPEQFWKKWEQRKKKE